MRYLHQLIDAIVSLISRPEDDGGRWWSTEKALSLFRIGLIAGIMFGVLPATLDVAATTSEFANLVQDLSDAGAALLVFLFMTFGDLRAVRERERQGRAARLGR